MIEGLPKLRVGSSRGVLHWECVVAVTSALVVLVGCAIGPNYKRPAVDSPAQFRSAPEGIATNSLADLAWWDVYKDERLKGLIGAALTNNYDLRIAAARVEQA